jgi:hypothetical protein
MARLPAAFEELADLTWALANGRLEAEGAARLGQLLDADAANRRAYIRLTNQFAALEWEAGESARQRAEGRPDAADRLLDDAPATRRVGQTAARTVEGPGAGVAFPSFVACPLPLGPSRLNSYRLDSFGGVLLSYAVVAVALGIGVAGAWVWHVGENSQVATAVAIPTAAPVPSQKAGGNAERVCVGTVTAANKCVWRGSNTLASCAAAAKFELVSGVLEITYGAGVKVSIRGPAYYVVRSADIGYLGMGTLTVRLDEVSDARSGGPGKAGGSQPPPAGKSPSRNPPSAARLFTVQTPNMDIRGGRGAVFNVLVAPTAECYTEIYRGSVGLVPLDNEEEELVALCQGQSALLALNARGEPTLVVGTGEPPAFFARQMPNKWPDFSSSEAIRGKTRQQDKRDFRWRQSELGPS